jgi:hypothetical protein
MNPKLILSLTTGMLMSSLLLTESLATPVMNAERKPASLKTKSTTYSSRNNRAVRIYPDVIKKSMHVVAKDNEGMMIDFFVFDLQGTLLKHYKMVEGDHEKINGLKRGKYIYQVFCGDEETAIGKFEIR